MNTFTPTPAQARFLDALGTDTATIYTLRDRMGLPRTTAALRNVRLLVQQLFKAGVITTDYQVGEAAAYRLI